MYGNVFQPVQQLTEAVKIFPGGLCDVLFTPYENVLTWPTIDPQTGGVSDEIILEDGAEMFSAEFNKLTKKFQEEVKETNAGTHHEFVINATLPGNVNENVLALGTMLFHRFLVIFKEKNGVYRFLGNEDSGAKITYNYTSGDGDSSRNRIIKITWSHPNPAPIYLGTLTEIPITTTGGSFMFIERFKVKAGEAIQPGESTYANALIEGKKVFVIINEQKVLSGSVNNMDADRYIDKDDVDDNFTLVDANGDPVAFIENDNVEIYAHD
jgi:hypothetical protein